MQLSSIYAAVRERIGNPTVGEIPNSTLITRINEAYGDIWDNYRFHANRGRDVSITTVAGTDTYTIPATVDIIMSVTDVTNRRLLDKIDRNAWDSNHSTAQAKPTSLSLI